MRRFTGFAVAATVALLSVAVAGQAPAPAQGGGQGRGGGGGRAAGPPVVAPTTIATFMDHQNVMRSNAQQAGNINRGVMMGDIAAAKAGAAQLRTNYTTLRTFYSSKMKADAVTIIDNGLTAVTGVDTLLNAAMPDAMAVAAAVKMAQGTCGACHMAHRTGDNQTGFNFTDPSIRPPG
jgi:mono/diheme cytochrome c family protein